MYCILDNLLHNHPDGAGEYIIATYVDNERYPLDEFQSDVDEGMDEGDIVVFVHTPSGETLALFFGSELHQVEEAVAKGNVGVDEWVNSEAGIYYRDEVLNYLKVDIANSTYEVKHLPTVEE